MDNFDELRVQQISAELLAAVYDLKVFWRKDHRKAQFDLFCKQTANGQVLAGLVYLRGAGTHQQVQRTEPTDQYADTYTNQYATWSGPTKKRVPRRICRMLRDASDLHSRWGRRDSN